MVVDRLRRVGDQVAPRRCGRCLAEAEEPDRRLDHDRGAGEQERLDEDRADESRDDVAPEDLHLGEARGAGGSHVQLVLSGGDRAAAEHADEAGAAEDPERDHRDAHAVAEHGEHDEQDDDAGDRETSSANSDTTRSIHEPK